MYYTLSFYPPLQDDLAAAIDATRRREFVLGG
jgi:hypothetical protein